MKIKLSTAVFLFILSIQLPLNSQNIYRSSSGEMIFSWANLAFTDAFKDEFPMAEITNNPLRFSTFFHAGHYLHIDFNNTFGFFTGLAIRNIGSISNEVLPINLSPTSIIDYQEYKVIRRLYTLGVPIGLKVGSLKKNFYFFGGAEMEWAFHSKEKWWNTHNRSGVKTKISNWFPENARTFIPSVFGGIQFRKGTNIKFKYYLAELINRSYTGNKSVIDISNLSRYKPSQTMYISISKQIKRKSKPKGIKKDGETEIPTQKF